MTHDCMVIRGKCHHVCRDSQGRFYCMYCLKELDSSELADKYIKKRKENER